MTFNIADLDIDTSEATRNDILNKLQHIPASKITDKGIFPHNVGAYFCDIPEDRMTGLASIDYKSAEEDYGFFKIDLLHNTVYDSFKTRDEMIECLNKSTDWNNLKKQNIVEQLPHINNYFTLLSQLPSITSVEELAMFIAIIRPGKKHLINKVMTNGWNSIIDEIWVKEDNGYQFKKSHAIAYALMIKVALNYLEGK